MSEKGSQWEKMQVFYSSIPHWPSTDMLDKPQQGVLPIVQMQQQTTPAEARLKMYTWHGYLDTDGQIDQPPGQSSLISQALWNRQQDNDLPTMPVNSATPQGQSQHSQDPLKPTMHHHPNCHQKVPRSTDTIMQWEEMREFYSNNPLWPSLDQENFMGTDGESPLVWMMLHPPLVETRLQSFAWRGHLEFFCLGVNPTTSDQLFDSHLSPMPCGTSNEALLGKCCW